MEEATQEKKARSNNVLWILVLVAVVVLWWWFRPEGAHHKALPKADDAAQVTTDGADPDDILVDLRDDASAAQVRALDQDLGIDLQLVADPEAKGEQLYRAHVAAGDEQRILAALSQRSEVEIAEPDSVMSIPAGEESFAADLGPADAGWPNDPDYKYQWHLKQIGMPEAWKTASGEGVVVAVIDTGVAYENFGKFHEVEDLKGTEYVDPYDFVDNDPHANDDHAHGTHVAGTIAQRTNNGIGVAGVAYKAKIMPLKVLGASGSGSVAGIADAIRFAADHHADIINMSLGGPFPSRIMKKAVEYAHKKGVVIVAAAGNESRNKVGYPAAYPGVIAVAATQYDESTTFYSNSGKDVDIAAPGGNTRVDQNGDGKPDGVLQNTIETGQPTKSGYFAFMGTSMASPHVAGVAALVVQQGIHDPDQVEKILTETARQPKAQKYERDRYGAGIVDAPAAIAKARGQAGAARTASEERRWGSELGAIVIGLLIAGAVASGRRRGSKLGVSYLGGVVAAVAAFACIGALGIGANVVAQSALLPLAALALGYGVAKLRGPLAGAAAGAAGHLLVLAVARPDLAWLPSSFGFSAVWLAANAAACVWLAKAAVRR
jgi:serine protease